MREDTRLRKLYPWFTVLGLIVGALVIAAYYKDQFREWKFWQGEYVKQELARASTAEQRESAKEIPIEIKQFVLSDLNRVDRCMTCHIAAEDPSYGGYPQPLAYHPNHDQHPFEKFGCTICHQGQGSATTREAAHGNVPHWDRPMLPMKYITSACAKCHLPENVPNAPKLARGQALFEEVGCIGCHKLHGRGGVVGPELDKIGALRGPDWLIKHFKSPASVSPGSAMPAIHVSDADLEALTLYVLSFTGEELSAYYVSMTTIPGPQAGRNLFETKGCLGCHSVGGKGGTVGPALDKVGERRKPEWIMEHFRNPQSVSPGSVMPQFDLTEQQVRALTEFLLSLSDPNLVGYIKVPSMMTPVERGKAVFKKYGCAGCHGQEGKGGIPNPNAKTGQQVPKLIYVAEGYTKEELRKRILNGQREIFALDRSKPAPPLFMPAWRDKIAEGELQDLIEYLFSLLPQEEKLDF
jgi:mono/diheme cytochrome c family protein